MRHRTARRYFIIIPEISHSDVSGISTKIPCEVALMGERHVRIEISDFVMRTFVLMQEISHSDVSRISTKALDTKWIRNPGPITDRGDRYDQSEYDSIR